MKVNGLLSISDLKEKVELGEIETVITAFPDHYGRLMGKRYDAEFFLESVVSQGSHACNYLLTTDMEMKPVEGYQLANWEKGYGDFHLVPDMKSLRIAHWLENTAMVICDVQDSQEKSNVKEAPRSILQKQLQKLAKKGIKSFTASELEYYLYEDDFRTANVNQYNNLTPVGWYLEDYHILQGSRIENFTAAARKHLKNSGIPVESSKGEWGLGQHELNVKYTGTLEMADRHIIYKQCLKELADQMDLSVTFMAKVHEDQAGSSCHVHISLWDKDRNIFVGDHDYGSFKASKEFGSFLAGWIRYVPDMMVFYAPTINSYKRFVNGSWAPTCLAWSKDNRTAGFRVVGHGDSLRIECRIPGADANPYLVFAAALASGLKGIEDEIEPPPIFTGDAYASNDIARVPFTLKESLEIFTNSRFAREAFSDQVVDHYSHFYKSEIEAFSAAVTDWERKRYFERI